MARPTGLEPVTYGLAYPLRLSPPWICPPGSPGQHNIQVCGLDYIFTISGGARIVSTDPGATLNSNADYSGFLGIAIAVTR